MGVTTLTLNLAVIFLKNFEILKFVLQIVAKFCVYNTLRRYYEQFQQIEKEN